MPSWRGRAASFVLVGLLAACGESPAAHSAGAERLALLTPAAGASGLPFTTAPVVAVHDRRGRIVPITGLVVSMQVIGAAALTGTLEAATIDGVATFPDAGISGSGSFTIQYSAPELEAIGQSITPAPGTPTRLVLQRPAAGAAAGVAVSTSPIVLVHDAAGNTVPIATQVSCWLVRQDAPTDTVALRSTNTAAGVATFEGLTVTGRAGSHALVFRAEGLLPVEQSLTVVAGPAWALRFVVPPRGATVGVALPVQPVVEVTDRYGNVAADVVTVTASVNNDGTLSGATAALTTGGAATFSDLAIAGTPGTIYNLSFGSGTLNPAAASLPLWAQGSGPMPSHVSIHWPSDPPCCVGNALSLGEQVPLTALVLDQFATPMQADVTWQWYNWIGPPSFSTPRVSVSSSGLVTALSPGSAQVLAVVQIGEESLSASTSVHVRWPE